MDPQGAAEMVRTVAREDIFFLCELRVKHAHSNHLFIFFYASFYFFASNMIVGGVREEKNPLSISGI